MILRRVKILSEVEAAYIAGMIDGDGCLYIGPQKNSSDSYRIVVKVTCKEKLILDWLYEHTGVGNVYVHKAYSPHQHDATYYEYRITSHKDVVDLVERIYPYTVTKKRRCELMYHLGKHMQNRLSGRLTDKEREWRTAIYQEFKSLQSHQPIANEGELGGSPSGIIPSQATHSNKTCVEGVEVSPEIMDISALPDREDMTRAALQSAEVEWI